MLVFPTIKHLEALRPFESVDEVLAHVRRLDVVPVQPRVVVRDGTAEVLMPGRAGLRRGLMRRNPRAARAVEDGR